MNGSDAIRRIGDEFASEVRSLRTSLKEAAHAEALLIAKVARREERILELERGRDEKEARLDAARKAWDAAASERDSLKAQVQEMGKALRESAERYHRIKAHDPMSSHDPHGFGDWDSCNSLPCRHAKFALAGLLKEGE